MWQPSCLHTVRLAVGETDILMKPPFYPYHVLKRLIKGRGGCSRMTVSPTARPAAARRAKSAALGGVNTTVHNCGYNCELTVTQQPHYIGRYRGTVTRSCQQFGRITLDHWWPPSAPGPGLGTRLRHSPPWRSACSRRPIHPAIARLALRLLHLPPRHLRTKTAQVAPSLREPCRCPKATDLQLPCMGGEGRVATSKSSATLIESI